MKERMFKLIDGTTIVSETEVLNAYEIMTGIIETEVTADILNKCKGIDAELNPTISDLFKSIFNI